MDRSETVWHRFGPGYEAYLVAVSTARLNLGRADTAVTLAYEESEFMPLPQMMRHPQKRSDFLTSPVDPTRHDDLILLVRSMRPRASKAR